MHPLRFLPRLAILVSCLVLVPALATVKRPFLNGSVTKTYRRVARGRQSNWAALSVSGVRAGRDKRDDRVAGAGEP
jgi:hypothetical protein